MSPRDAEEPLSLGCLRLRGSKGAADGRHSIRARGSYIIVYYTILCYGMVWYGMAQTALAQAGSFVLTPQFMLGNITDV